MSDKTEKNIQMENIVSLAKRRGFIYPGSDVYGGLSGTWDYGPLGVTLKRNIMQLWWKMFVDDRDDMYGVDAAILMNQKVWQASGHVDTFTDPLVECRSCNSRLRVDKLVNTAHFQEAAKFLSSLHAKDGQELDEKIDEVKGALEYYGEKSLENDKLYSKFREILEPIKQKGDFLKKDGADIVDMASYIGPYTQFYLNDLKKIQCSNCQAVDWGEPRRFNMMFTTHVGAVNDDSSIVYLRPETAQGIFTNYKNVVDTFYPDLPFGLAQQGKAFRNEISPRDFIFRSREFEQMEIEYFVNPDDWEVSFAALLKDIHAYLEALGLPADKIHELEVDENDRAHYSKRTIDIEYDFPIGREELLGLAYRTNFDLMNIQNNAGKSMEYTIKGTNTKFVPHVIEPSFGVERAVMAVLSAAYREDEINGEKRVYLAFPEHLAPVRYCVSPLLKNKPELVAKAREVYQILKQKHGNVMWDDNGNIGKRYRRQDEIGTPYCVVIDFDTLDDDTVTIRDRDTTSQKRINITEL